MKPSSSVRTSVSHPLQIAEVRAHSSHGRIGITFCPGKQDQMAATGSWQRDLHLDLQVISDWGAKRIITLVEHQELIDLKVPHLGDAVERRGMEWRHLPIADYSVPTEKFEQEWLTEGRELRTLLRGGHNVLVHCKGGLGRAGMISARLLVEMGIEPTQAIRSVRKARQGAIETPAQLALIRRTCVITEASSL